jgi:HlyD family secretion protein
MAVLRGIVIVCALLLSACAWDEGTRVQGYVYQEPIYISSTQTGALFTLNVERGQMIKKGQALFSLDPAPEDHNLLAVEQQLAQAQSTLMDLEKASRETVLEGLEGQVSQASANLDIAQKKAARFQALFEKNALDAESRDEAVADAKAKQAALDTAQANLAEAEQGARVDAIKAQQALVKSLEAQVQSAQWALAQKTMVAPMDALVVDTFYRPGENIAATQPVLELYDPQRLFAIFYINEPLLSEICLGQEIHIAHDRQNKKIPAIINYISPTAEYTPPVIYSRDNNQTLVFRIEALLPAEQVKSFHAGEPIDVYLKEGKHCHD